MALSKTLPRIAAIVLHNTHVFPKNLKEKFELIATAYGAATVEADFEEWCEGLVEKGTNPRYPITEYVKVVDERLGKSFEEKKADLKDPRIVEIASLSYSETGFVPSGRSVGNLLLDFSLDEIKSALVNYASTLNDKEVKSGMKTFFTEGGAAAVIMTFRKRNPKTEEKF
jgi:hypothetical protein